jgi:hypothetical protein
MFDYYPALPLEPGFITGKALECRSGVFVSVLVSSGELSKVSLECIKENLYYNDIAS